MIVEVIIIFISLLPVSRFSSHPRLSHPIPLPSSVTLPSNSTRDSPPHTPLLPVANDESTYPHLLAFLPHPKTPPPPPDHRPPHCPDLCLTPQPLLPCHLWSSPPHRSRPPPPPPPPRLTHAVPFCRSLHSRLPRRSRSSDPVTPRQVFAAPRNHHHRGSDAVATQGFRGTSLSHLESLPAVWHCRYATMRDLDRSLQDLESLPAVLHRSYATMRDLDRSLQVLQRQNEQRCEQEIIDMKRGIESGELTANVTIKFSDEAIDEQKHCVRIADEKVALATQAYDMVDAQIQLLDQYMRKFEELRQEKEASATAGTSSINAVGSARSMRGDGTSKGGRNRTRPAVEPPSVSLDLPVDPNEPTYCLCNQVSYGEMVACDNPDCKIEWFHFGCVGLKEQPKGKWYCSNCASIKKYRKGK